MKSELREKLSDDLIAALKVREVPNAPEEATRLIFRRSAAIEGGPKIKVSIDGRGDIYAEATIECGWRDMPSYEIFAKIAPTTDHALWTPSINGIIDRIVDVRQKRLIEQEEGIYRREKLASHEHIPFINLTRDSENRRVWLPQIWMGPNSRMTHKIVLPDPQSASGKDLKKIISHERSICECPMLIVMRDVIRSVNIVSGFYRDHQMRIEMAENPGELTVATMLGTDDSYTFFDVCTIRVAPVNERIESGNDLFPDADDSFDEDWLF